MKLKCISQCCNVCKLHWQPTKINSFSLRVVNVFLWAVTVRFPFTITGFVLIWSEQTTDSSAECDRTRAPAAGRVGPIDWETFLCNTEPPTLPESEPVVFQTNRWKGSIICTRPQSNNSSMFQSQSIEPPVSQRRPVGFGWENLFYKHWYQAGF